MKSHFSKQLKSIRNIKGLSLTQLADKANVSKSMISKIERDEVQPTLEITIRLASALEQQLSEMLHPTNSADVVILHKQDRPTWVESGTNIARTMLTPAYQKAGLEMLHFKMPSHTTTKMLPPMQNGCEKTIIMLKGKLELVLDNETYKIAAGDSIYFKANISREIKNTATAIAEYYMIIKYI